MCENARGHLLRDGKHDLIKDTPRAVDAELHGALEVHRGVQHGGDATGGQDILVQGMDPARVALIHANNLGTAVKGEASLKLGKDGKRHIEKMVKRREERDVHGQHHRFDEVAREVVPEEDVAGWWS